MVWSGDLSISRVGGIWSLMVILRRTLPLKWAEYLRMSPKLTMLSLHLHPHHRGGGHLTLMRQKNSVQQHHIIPVSPSLQSVNCISLTFYSFRGWAKPWSFNLHECLHWAEYVDIQYSRDIVYWFVPCSRWQRTLKSSPRQAWADRIPLEPSWGSWRFFIWGFRRRRPPSASSARQATGQDDRTSKVSILFTP